MILNIKGQIITEKPGVSAKFRTPFIKTIDIPFVPYPNLKLKYRNFCIICKDIKYDIKTTQWDVKADICHI